MQHVFAYIGQMIMEFQSLHYTPLNAIKHDIYYDM